MEEAAGEAECTRELVVVHLFTIPGWPSRFELGAGGIRRHTKKTHTVLAIHQERSVTE